MAATRSTSASKLRQLAQQIDMDEQRQARRIETLNREIRTLREEKDDVEERLAEAGDEKKVQDELISALRTQLDEAKARAKEVEERFAHEIIGLRFELAETCQALRKSNHKEAISRELRGESEPGDRDGTSSAARDGPSLTGAGLSLFSAESLIHGADPDLMLPGAFVDAARRGLSGVVRSVLKPEANQERKERLRDTLGQALLELCAQGTAALDTIKMLLEYGADPSVAKPAAEGGRTALHVAAAKGSKELVDMLLGCASVEIDRVDARGRTALHLSARLRKAEASKALLMKGADQSIPTPEGHTARDLALNSDGAGSFSLSFAPMNIKQVFESPSVRFWNSSALALRRYREERWTDAMDAFTSAVDLAKANPRVAGKNNLARLYYNRARLSVKLGEILQALEDCNEALNLDEAYTNALEIRADCHWSLFDFERAAADFDTLRDQATDPAKRAEWSKRHAESRRCSEASHYQVLGLAKRATAAEIKRAFRAESIKWHPDKHARSHEDAHRARKQFQRINEAREVLLNANQRIVYDAGQGFGSNRSYFFDDDLYDLSDDEEDDRGAGRAARGAARASAFPWNDKVLSTPLHEAKHSYKERQLEKEKAVAAASAAAAATEAAEAQAARSATAAAASRMSSERAPEHQKPGGLNAKPEFGAATETAAAAPPAPPAFTSTSASTSASAPATAPMTGRASAEKGDASGAKPSLQEATAANDRDNSEGVGEDGSELSESELEEEEELGDEDDDDEEEDDDDEEEEEDDEEDEEESLGSDMESEGSNGTASMLRSLEAYKEAILRNEAMAFSEEDPWGASFEALLGDLGKRYGFPRVDGSEDEEDSSTNEVEGGEQESDSEGNLQDETEYAHHFARKFGFGVHLTQPRGEKSATSAAGDMAGASASSSASSTTPSSSLDGDDLERRTTADSPTPPPAAPGAKAVPLAGEEHFSPGAFSAKPTTPKSGGRSRRARNRKRGTH